MYSPKHFAQPDLAAMHELVEAFPLAVLVTCGAEGLTANHIPMLLDRTTGAYGTLRCHVARANPVCRDVTNGTMVMAIFQGPQAYVSPAWYPSKIETEKVVPTWNYAVVHAYGEIRVVDDSAWIRTQIESLTAQMESTAARPWAVTDAPADYIERMSQAIVGLEITISKLEGKWKLSQNQSERDRDGVIAGLRQQGADMMADWVAMASRQRRETQ